MTGTKWAGTTIYRSCFCDRHKVGGLQPHAFPVGEPGGLGPTAEGMLCRETLCVSWTANSDPAFLIYSK